MFSVLFRNTSVCPAACVNVLAPFSVDPVIAHVVAVVACAVTKVVVLLVSVTAPNVNPSLNVPLVTPLNVSAPAPPSTAPACCVNVPPLTVSVRPAATAIGPLVVKLAPAPDCASVTSPPLTSIVPLFTCAALARLSVSAWLTVTVP